MNQRGSELSTRYTNSNFSFKLPFRKISAKDIKLKLSMTGEIELLNIRVPEISWNNSEQDDITTSMSEAEKNEEEDEAFWEQFSQTESSCIPPFLKLTLPDLVKRDPYVILNSLTSQQIRRLISTSYDSSRNYFNVALKRKSVEFDKPSVSKKRLKRSNESGKPRAKKNKTKTNGKCKCNKHELQQLILERLSTPTHASKIRSGVSNLQFLFRLSVTVSTC